MKGPHLIAWTTVAIIAAVVLVLAVASSVASGEGPHGACDDGVVGIVGTQDSVSYDVSPNVVDGVCLKAGNTQLHTLYATDFSSGCYTVTGIGTHIVTVTREGEGRSCQGISHIDVLTSTPTPTPTPTPSATLTPTPSPTPITTPTPTDPVSTPTLETPSALPDTGGEPSESGGIPWWVAVLVVGGSALASVGVLLMWSRENK